MRSPHIDIATQYTIFAMEKIAKAIQNGKQQIITPNLPSPQIQQKLVTDLERIELVKKLRKQQLKIQKQRILAVKRQQQKNTAQQNKIKFIKQKEKQQYKEQKRKQVLKRIEIMQKERKQKQNQFQIQNQQLKRKLTQKTMFVKMQQKYRKFQASMIEERNIQLNKQRQRYRPLDWQAIKNEKPVARNSPKHIFPSIKNPLFYKSPWYQEIKKQRKNDDSIKSAEELLKKKENRERTLKYAQRIQISHKPNISVLLSPKADSKPELDFEQKKKLGLEYLQYAKKQIKRNALSEPQIETQICQKYPNYLIQNKIQHKETDKVHNFLKEIEKLKLPQFYKTRVVMDYALRKEEEAKRKQQIQQNGGKQADGKQYLQAIEAKLSLIKSNN